ncbi:hypothetical protein P3S67_010179 [Capsicum chacoense]
MIRIGSTNYLFNDKNWFYKLSFSGQLLNDIHINVILYYLRKKGKYSPPSNYSYTTINCVFKIKVAELWKKYVDPQSCTSLVSEEHAVCEYMNGYTLRVVSFLDRCLYVYNSYNSAIHDVYVKAEMQKFAEVIPSSFLNIDFYKKKIDID